ncbi:uncharacterized protein BDZ99DRAFT_538040 [Mytilinidion resinicola]|uniref:Uncharacterized protein n=1 Tax=Mytilinidion resinicola TaxID=574789 RepID=A0A6A6YEI0_9PEZI|nr:uncharacterized protein BDZ99DRAFT_538040 [Mytilinidion resinicola]KAF2807009.1 hypothetical protein BDZ99DRAFT_538040 [Mytilinidion resinicola]
MSGCSYEPGKPYFVWYCCNCFDGPLSEINIGCPMCGHLRCNGATPSIIRQHPVSTYSVIATPDTVVPTSSPSTTYHGKDVSTLFPPPKSPVDTAGYQDKDVSTLLPQSLKQSTELAFRTSKGQIQVEHHSSGEPEKSTTTDAERSSSAANFPVPRNPIGTPMAHESPKSSVAVVFTDSDTDSEQPASTSPYSSPESIASIGRRISQHTRRVVNHIMNNLHFDFDLARGLITCTGGDDSYGPSSTPSTGPEVSWISGRGSGRGQRKRNLGHDGSESPDDDQDEGHKRPKPNTGFPATGDTSDRKLACPYFKRNPSKHNQCSSCSGPGFPTVARMKFEYTPKRIARVPARTAPAESEVVANMSLVYEYDTEADSNETSTPLSLAARFQAYGRQQLPVIVRRQLEEHFEPKIRDQIEQAIRVGIEELIATFIRDEVNSNVNNADVAPDAPVSMSEHLPTRPTHHLEAPAQSLGFVPPQVSVDLNILPDTAWPDFPNPLDTMGDSDLSAFLHDPTTRENYSFEPSDSFLNLQTLAGHESGPSHQVDSRPEDSLSLNALHEDEPNEAFWDELLDDFTDGGPPWQNYASEETQPGLKIILEGELSQCRQAGWAP